MDQKPYHHIYKDGKLFAFRNPEGSPQRNPNFKWKWKVFSEEKLKIDYPAEHVIDKKLVLKNIEKHKSNHTYCGLTTRVLLLNWEILQL